MLLIVFCANTLLSQSNNRQISDAWGESDHGVQLSITISNSVVAVGSEFIIAAEIKNSSTNIIYFGESSPEMDFNVILTSGVGKIFKLTPPAVVFARLLHMDLKPRETRNWIIHVGVDRYFEPPGLAAINKNIEAGNYTLKATRFFSFKTGRHELASNSIELLIK